MEIHGVVQNGVVVPANGTLLPEGASVRIVAPEIVSAETPTRQGRIKLPLVHCVQPGTVHLTNDRIGELLDEEDAAARH